MIPDDYAPLSPAHLGREAERLRAILETLVTTQPHLPLSDAVPLVFRIEAHAANREREELERLYAGTSNGGVPANPSLPPEIAAWIDAPTVAARQVRDYIRDGKVIDAIKGVRATLGVTLKEAKAGVEWWRDRHMVPTSTPASSTYPF